MREAPQQGCADTGNRPGVTTQTHPRPTPPETPSAIRPEHDPTTDREDESPSQSGQETVRTRSGRVIRAPAPTSYLETSLIKSDLHFDVLNPKKSV